MPGGFDRNRDQTVVNYKKKRSISRIYPDPFWQLMRNCHSLRFILPINLLTSAIDVNEVKEKIKELKYF